ncbi:alkaline phosphatase family protein [Streptacidiphilus fuscans]|uniref:Acid phosphatase n=1 Tax=Streptacidiphilus fuscans TaxID=2789292 RepID=A0A931B1R6_9ACTN|nr:alkaline phosphatase family protein [Streptacidiphilus fuscans]MBF9069595.1 acid phosphatase [Streptacidiphilus fuscans]
MRPTRRHPAARKPAARTLRSAATAASAAVVTLLALTGCSSGGPSEPSAVQSSLAAQTDATASAAAGSLPAPQHVVLVMEENHSYSDIIGSSDAPYINALASQGALFTSSYAVAHPSEPNYAAIFSGSTQGLTDDSCPHTFTGPNLGSELLASGRTFAGYSESLPNTGYTGCNSGDYARRHNPWVNFPNIPASDNRPFAAFPTSAAGFAALPTLSIVVPNVQNDMHDGTVQQGDTWLKDNLSAYATWAKTHDSLLVVTWDEDDNSASNHIPTLVAGANVRPGHYAELVDHYRTLRTLESLYGLSPVGESAQRQPVTDIWQP